MQPSQKHNQQGQTDTAAGEFFVPDLCAPRPVFVLVMLAELLVLVHVLASSALPRFDWDMLAVGSLFVQWIVLLCAVLLCVSRKLFAGMSLSLGATACLIIILLVSAASSYLAVRFYPQLLYDTYANSAGNTGNWWIARNVALAAILGGISLRYFYLRHQMALREKSELQARIDSLRSRIRPHFLFNTMNSIASLIASQPDAAERAVEDLSELFRASLQENTRVVTVDDELHLCELYLGIEKLRLGERLQVEWRVDPAARSQPMPSLILQPLVENAVYHGIAQLPRGGAVVVRVAQTQSHLRVSVENPVPIHAAQSQGHHMALNNIELRLHALYGGEGGIKSVQSETSFLIELSYPLDYAG
ncbi:MAG: two-component system sensor histidine kinase AlgZ [Halioglobus sp.]|jgi:two-component system sensor histidine kinase AlgZ